MNKQDKLREYNMKNFFRNLKKIEFLRNSWLQLNDKLIKKKDKLN